MMFFWEYSCYPKPVLHLYGPVPFWNPSFKVGCCGAVCPATLLSSTIAQLTGTRYPNLTCAWAVWRACCLLSWANQLILHCHKDWKAEVPVITLGGSFCVCFQKAAGRQNSGDSICVCHICQCCWLNWPRSPQVLQFLNSAIFKDLH